MTLQPLQQDTSARYPARKANLVKVGGRWIRKIGVAVAASALFLSAGCLFSMGGEPVGPEYSYSVCGSGWESDHGEIAYPGAFEGCLEMYEAAEGTLNIEERVTLRFDFTDELTSPGEITADLIDPEGNVAETIVGAEPVEIELAPGIWTLAVNSSEPYEGDFMLFIDIVE